MNLENTTGTHDGPRLSDPARLEAIRAAALIDDDVDPAFEGFVRLVALHTRTPTALVSVVDDRRQFFRGMVGLGDPWAAKRETPLSLSFCERVVRTRRPWVVNDTRADPSLASHGATVELGVVAYLGVPFFGPGGQTLGAVCAIDSVPRAWTDGDVAFLEQVAVVVSATVELRTKLRAHSGAFAATDEVPWELDLTRDVRPIIDRIEHLLGHRPGAFASLAELVHPDDWGALESTFRTWEMGGLVGSVTVECRARTPDGGFSWLRATGRKIDPEASSVAPSVAGTVRRVDAEVQERQRRLREARLEGMAERFHDIELVMQRGGTIVDANDYAVAAYGLPVAELRGRNIRDLRHTAARDSLDDAFDRLQGDGRLVLETLHRRSDGSPFPVLVAARAFELGSERVIHSLIRDLTEPLRVQDRLKRARVLDGLTVMAGGVAHDFNNLMFSVLTNVNELMALHHPDPDVPGLLANIKLGAKRATDLTRQLLMYAGKGEVKFNATDVAELVRETVDLVTSTASPRPAVQLEVEGDLSPIQADATKLRQVVMNLVKNAVDASRGALTLHIAVRRRDLDATFLADAQGAELTPGSYMVVRVADDGIGMSADVQSRIFEPFFTTKRTGRGLGLASTLGIVRAHGGAIRVQSAAGRGTTIDVVLPIDDVAPTSGPVALASSQLVLLADDEASLRESLARSLGRVGFQVLTARDGVEAIELFRARRHDLHAVVLDLSMPRMGGADTIAAMRAIDPEARAVLMTGYADQAAKQRFAGVPHTALLLKPFDPNDLATLLLALGRQQHL